MFAKSFIVRVSNSGNICDSILYLKNFKLITYFRGWNRGDLDESYFSFDGEYWLVVNAFEKNSSDAKNLLATVRKFDDVSRDFEEKLLTTLENPSTALALRLLNIKAEKDVNRFRLIPRKSSDESDHLINLTRFYDTRLVTGSYLVYLPRYKNDYREEKEVTEKGTEVITVLNIDAPKMHDSHFHFEVILLKLDSFFLALLLDPALATQEMKEKYDNHKLELISDDDYSSFLEEIGKLSIAEFATRIRTISKFMSKIDDWTRCPVDLMPKSSSPSDEPRLLLSAVQYRYLASLRRKRTQDQLKNLKSRTWDNMRGRGRDGKPCYSNRQLQLQRYWLLNKSNAVFAENDIDPKSFNMSDLHLEQPTIGSLEWLFKYFLDRAAEVQQPNSCKNLHQAFQSLWNVMIRTRLHQYFQQFYPIPYQEVLLNAEQERQIMAQKKLPDYLLGSLSRDGAGCLLTKCLKYEDQNSRRRKISNNKRYFASYDKNQEPQIKRQRVEMLAGQAARKGPNGPVISIGRGDCRPRVRPARPGVSPMLHLTTKQNEYLYCDC